MADHSFAALAEFARFADRPVERDTPTLGWVRTHREPLLVAARHYRAANVRVVGSVARETAGPESDVDFLVDLPEDYRLLELGGLYTTFEDALGRPVHVVPTNGLAPHLLATMLRDAVPL